MRSNQLSVRWAGALVGLSFLGSAAALGQTAPPLFHDPWLNWDFINFTGQPVNDFEIVVETPNWSPGIGYTGSLGFPQFTTTTGDYVPSNPGEETRMSWSGRTFEPGAIAHVGAYMNGSGRILDAYWTFNGVKVGPSIGIVYELTRVTPLQSGQGGIIDMVLQTSPAFVADNPGAMLQLQNIRTFMDLPATLLDLDDLTRDLELATLQSFETTPGSPVADLTADSFFDVFVGQTVNNNPGFEALLVADVVTTVPGTPSQVIGRFWNLNPQSPEPATLGLVMMLAGTGLTRPRRNHG